MYSINVDRTKTIFQRRRQRPKGSLLLRVALFKAIETDIILLMDIRNIYCVFWFLIKVQKSDNLQYNKLACWLAGTNDTSTKRLIFQAFFFHDFLLFRALKTLYLYIFFKWENKLKLFLQWILHEIMKKKILGTLDTWSMIRLSQRSSVLYWRLLDFNRQQFQICGKV